MFKSLNEGLADYWGWVYSKDEKFVSVSIPSEKNRSLQDPSYGFPSSEQRQQQIDSLFEAYISSQDKERALETIQDVGARYAYSLGNQYARFFRSLTTTAEGRNLEAPLQVEFVKKIVSLLNDIRESMLKNKSRDAIQPENIIENFRNKNPEIFKNNCSQFQSVTKKDLSCAGRDQ